MKDWVIVYIDFGTEIMVTTQKAYNPVEALQMLNIPLEQIVSVQCVNTGVRS